MKIKMVHKDRKSVEFTMEGIDVSILQILQSFLFKDGRVRNVAFRQSHPILKTTSFWVEVSKGDPEEVIIEACKKAIEEVDDLKKEILASLEGEIG